MLHLDKTVHRLDALTPTVGRTSFAGGSAPKRARVDPAAIDHEVEGRADHRHAYAASPDRFWLSF
jgi:hypothetical protein